MAAAKRPRSVEAAMRILATLSLLAVFSSPAVVTAQFREGEEPAFDLYECATRATHILGRVRRDATIDMCEPIEGTHRGESSIDRRSGKSLLLERRAIQLDVRAHREYGFPAVCTAHRVA